MKKFFGIAVAALLAMAGESVAQCGPGGCGAGRASSSRSRGMAMSSKYNGGRSMSMASSQRIMMVQPPAPVQVLPPQVFVEPQPRVIVRERLVPVQAPLAVYAPIAVPVSNGSFTSIRRGPFGRIRQIDTTGSVNFAGPRRAQISQ